MLNITTVINKYVEPGYYECFINPERNEFETIIKSDPYHSFKAIIMSNGDIYVFNSSFSFCNSAPKAPSDVFNSSCFCFDLARGTGI